MRGNSSGVMTHDESPNSRDEDPGERTVACSSRHPADRISRQAQPKINPNDRDSANYLGDQFVLTFGGGERPDGASKVLNDWQVLTHELTYQRTAFLSWKRVRAAASIQGFHIKTYKEF
jgi:hypothetical protein